jgi:hypothetical protein
VRRGDHDRTGLRVPVGPPVPAHRFMESEPIRESGSAANGCAGNTVAIVSPALLAWKVDQEVKCPAGNGWPGSPAHVRTVYLPPWRVNLSGDGRRPESGWARRRWDSSSLLSSMEGAPPARERALKVRGGREAAGLDTSTFRWPLLNR